MSNMPMTTLSPRISSTNPSPHSASPTTNDTVSNRSASSPATTPSSQEPTSLPTNSGPQGIRNRVWKFIVKYSWQGLSSLVIAGIALNMALKAYSIASWTARKDFRDACFSEIDHNMDTSPACNIEFASALPLPPVRKRDFYLSEAYKPAEVYPMQIITFLEASLGSALLILFVAAIGFGPNKPWRAQSTDRKRNSFNEVDVRSIFMEFERSRQRITEHDWTNEGFKSQPRVTLTSAMQNIEDCQTHAHPRMNGGDRGWSISIDPGWNRGSSNNFWPRIRINSRRA